MSVDGTDCPVFEPYPFSSKMYSHKVNGPAVKYEVGVCLKTGHIVWINGPFVGSTNDGTIFRNGLSPILCIDEAVEVDRGYSGDDKMKVPNMGMTSKQRKMKSNARAQHEAVNGRLKNWNSLGHRFRHNLQKHHIVFRSILVLEQIKLNHGKKMFTVDGYNDSAIA